MPAAAWAARSGDPVLFAGQGVAAEADRRGAEAARRSAGLRARALLGDLLGRGQADRRASPAGVRRVSGEDPVTNAIEFARYADGDFGWNINDPGHGFVIARSDRPLDAAAAAPLSGSGTWGPLLLTDSAETLPGRCAATCSTSSRAIAATRPAPSTTTSG